MTMRLRRASDFGSLGTLVPGARGLTKRLLMALALVALLAAPAAAEFEDKVPGARAVGLGGACVTGDATPLSVYYNPAALGDGSCEVGFDSHRVKHFGLAELVHQAVYATAPRDGRLGGFGAGFETFGGGNYVEKTLTLAYGRAVSGSQLVGVAVKDLRSEIAATPVASTVALDLGWLVKLERGARAGLLIRNANSPTVNEPLGRTYQGGVSVPVTRRTRLTAELAKQDRGTDAQKRAVWMVGEEVRVSDLLTLRAGFTSRPARIGLGAGFHVREWILDYAFRSHEALDASHVFSLGRRW